MTTNKVKKTKQNNSFMQKKKYIQGIVTLLIAILLGCKPDREISYYPNGEIRLIIEDTDSSKNIKKFYLYFPNGQLERKYLFDIANEETIGKMLIYHTNGKIKKIIEKQKQGKIEGEVIFFDENGKFQMSGMYKDNLLIFIRYFNDCGDFSRIYYYDKNGEVDSVSYVYNGVDHLKIVQNFLRFEVNPDSLVSINADSVISIMKFGQSKEVKITKVKVFDKLILITGWIENIDKYGEKIDSLVRKMDKSMFVKLDTFITSDYNFTYSFTPTQKGKHLLVSQFVDIRKDSSDCYKGMAYHEFIVK